MKEFFAGNPVSRDYRHLAHRLCQPQMNKLALIYFLYTLIVSVGSAIAGVVLAGVGSALISLCTGAFVFSLINISKNVYLGIQVKTNDLFYGFNHFVRALCINLLSGLYVVLWSLIPIVGPFIGMVKAYSYAMAAYIALDNPDMGYNDCITRSRELMNGNKWQLFCLGLSYIGWYILSCFTFGILSFWINPRMNQAYFLFYLKVSGIGYAVEEERERLENEAHNE